MTNLNILRDALVGVSDKVYHYHAPNNAKPAYIVWAEDSADDFLADNQHVEILMSGTIDLFTKKENDPLFDSITEALNAIPCAFYLNSTQYEEETGLIHYEWVFQV